MATVSISLTFICYRISKIAPVWLFNDSFAGNMLQNRTNKLQETCI